MTGYGTSPISAVAENNITRKKKQWERELNCFLLDCIFSFPVVWYMGQDWGSESPTRLASARVGRAGTKQTRGPWGGWRKGCCSFLLYLRASIQLLSFPLGNGSAHQVTQETQNRRKQQNNGRGQRALASAEYGRERVRWNQCWEGKSGPLKFLYAGIGAPDCPGIRVTHVDPFYRSLDPEDSWPLAFGRQDSAASSPLSIHTVLHAAQLGTVFLEGNLVISNRRRAMFIFV